MSEANKAIALRFLKAMSENDSRAAAEVLAEDGCAVTKGYSKFAGTRPAPLVIGAIESFRTLFPQGLGLEVLTVLADGDRVVVEAEGHAVTGDGNPYANQYCFVMTLRDGRITQINEYLCSALAERQLWPLVERLGALQGAT